MVVGKDPTALATNQASSSSSESEDAATIASRALVSTSPGLLVAAGLLVLLIESLARAARRAARC